MKNGPVPTHPYGIYRVDAATASHINKQYSLITKITSQKVSEGDKICTNCFRKISKEEFDSDNDEINTSEAMNIDGIESIDYDDSPGRGQTNDDNEDLLSSQEQRHTKDEAKAKLNFVFQFLNIPTIRDMYVSNLSFSIILLFE